MNRDELKKALLQAFSEEGPDLFSKAENAVFSLEACDVSQQKNHLDVLKRALHSLKGSASAIGRVDIRDVSHAMEDILFFAEQEHAVKKSLGKLHEGLDYLRSAVSRPDEAKNPEMTLKLLLDKNAIFNESDTELNFEAVLAQESIITINEQLDPVIEVTSDSEIHLAQQNPETGTIADGKDQEIVDVKSYKPEHGKEASVSFINETIRVSVDKIESMQSTVGELVAIRLQQEDGLAKLSNIQTNVVSLNSGWRNLKHDLNEMRKQLPSAMVSRMDSKIAAFTSEIKSIQSKIFHLSNQMGNQTGQLTLLSDEMDVGLKAIRMMPLGPFLESYRSVARDAAMQLGKSVSVECFEKGVEIDRLILQKIKEPILHIIRNCVSHGIESKAERLAKGKPENGNIAIVAELDGEFVSISISDDGSGFDKQKIINKAVKMGLIAADETLSNSDILDLVSRPGFSTAEKADKVSGRGVGMDVVASTLGELGGSMELEFSKDFGSCFTLRVPSSLATSQGLILQVGEQRFGIVLDTVERIVRSKIDALDLVDGKRVIYINDEPISVTTLASVINMPQFEPKDSRVARPLVIIKTGNQRLALMVDDIPGEIPMIIKSLGPQFEHIQMYAGGAILSDGAVLPIVDARHIVNLVSTNHALRMDQLSEHNYEDETNQDETSSTQGVVIVVDDSITTRTLERNILEAAGYTVSVATDGIEALDLLMIEDNVSLLVTDLEMPRMNGLELCKSIRSGRYAHLPIIMVTSVGNEAEQRKGIEAGADAYIVKNDFQQETFLNTVKRLALH